jgi:hypothetical protein
MISWSGEILHLFADFFFPGDTDGLVHILVQYKYNTDAVTDIVTRNDIFCPVLPALALRIVL